MYLDYCLSLSFVYTSFFIVDGTRQTPVEAKLIKDGKVLPLKDVEVIVNEDKIIYKYKKPARNLSGMYQIKLSNGQGEEVKDVNIMMQDVPNPAQDVDVTEIFQTSCLVSWKAPTDDGGAPILKYIVERQDLSLKSGWDNVGEVPAGQPLKYRCEDLVHKKEYKFRIRAVNKLGPSEPAMFGKPVLAKDPWDEPSKPKDVDVVDWDKDHADLVWAKPDNDGGAPITGYVIEFKDKFGTEWSKGIEVPGDCFKGTVPGLKENQQYEFRVRAINKAGPGEPSDVTKPIIAKSRFVKPFIIGNDLVNVIVKKGQVIKYDIKYGGEPEPEVTWMLDNKELKEDAEQRITIDRYERNTVITTRRAVRADSGKCKLILKNSSGVCEGIAEVVVLGKVFRVTQVYVSTFAY